MLDCKTIYYKNGQKECEESDYGKEITKWYENGQKKSKQSEDWYGSKIITKWYEDGNKKYEESDRGRKFTKWYENGQKEHEESDRGGSIDKWHENGTKNRNAQLLRPEETQMMMKKAICKCKNWDEDDLVLAMPKQYEDGAFSEAMDWSGWTWFWLIVMLLATKGGWIAIVVGWVVGKTYKITQDRKSGAVDVCQFCDTDIDNSQYRV